MRAPAQLAKALGAVVLGGEMRPGAGAEEIQAFEQRAGIRLPRDARAFYEFMDGTTDMTNAAHGYVRFWPLAEWHSVHDEFPTEDHGARGGALIFADHLIWSAGFAAEFSDANADEMRIAIVGGPEVATTFSEFVELVLVDDPRIYGAG